MIASPGHRYGVALTLMGAAVLAKYLLQRSGTDTFALMVAASAISCWYGGALPSLLAAVGGWAVGWFLEYQGTVVERQSARARAVVTPRVAATTKASRFSTGRHSLAIAGLRRGGSRPPRTQGTMATESDL